MVVVVVVVSAVGLADYLVLLGKPIRVIRPAAPIGVVGSPIPNVDRPTNTRQRGVYCTSRGVPPILQVSQMRYG